MWPSHEDFHLLLVFIGVFLLTFVYYKQKQKHLISCDGSNPPSLTSLPVVGSLPFMPVPDKMHSWFLDKLPTMGCIIGFHAFSLYGIMIQTREALNEAFIKNARNFSNRPSMYLDHLMNPRMLGIIERPFDESFKKYHRLILSILRTFGFGNHSFMETRINLEVEALVADLRRQPSMPVHPKRAVDASVVNVIGNILFGRRFDRDNREAEELVANIHGYMAAASGVFLVNLFPFTRHLPVLRNRVANVIRIHDWLLEFLRQKIKEAESNRALDDNASFIKSFVEVDDDLEELVFILRDLIIAGTETSSATVQWAIIMLANHHEVQRRLHEEIDSVVGSASKSRSGGRLPSLADQTKLPYLEATILELQRYKSVVQISVPHATFQESKVNGYTIPPGTMVMGNLYAMHMDPAVWIDPDVFRPERFLDNEGNVKANMKDLVIPFSIGKRSCLGELLARQEVFLFVAGLVQNFEIFPPEGQDSVNCDGVASFIVSPLPFEVRFVPRDPMTA